MEFIFVAYVLTSIGLSCLFYSGYSVSAHLLELTYVTKTTAICHVFVSITIVSLYLFYSSLWIVCE